MTTAKLWGCNYDPNTNPALETAQGFKFDVFRDYATLDSPTKAYWKTLAAAGYLLILSLKFKNGGTQVPATTVTNGDHDAAIIAYVDFVIACAVSAHGKHVVDFEHEIDAATAALSGTPAELDAAYLHCAALARSRPGWAAACLLGDIVTGYNFVNNRDKLFAPTLAAADVIGFDPYFGNGGASSTWQSVDDELGPDVDDIVKLYPGKPIFLGEWGSYQGTTPGARAAKFAEFAKTLQGSRYDAIYAVCYWNSSSFEFDKVPADVAAFAAAGKALKTPPAPPAVVTVTVAKADYDAMAAQAALVPGLTADKATLTSSLQAAQAQLASATGALSSAQAALTTLKAAANAAASSLTAAAK